MKKIFAIALACVALANAEHGLTRCEMISHTDLSKKNYSYNTKFECNSTWTKTTTAVVNISFIEEGPSLIVYNCNITRNLYSGGKEIQHTMSQSEYDEFGIKIREQQVYLNCTSVWDEVKRTLNENDKDSMRVFLANVYKKYK